MVEGLLSTGPTPSSYLNAIDPVHPQQLTDASLSSILQFSSVQFSTVQYSTVQYSAAQCSTVHYSTIKSVTVQYITLQYSFGKSPLLLGP